MAYRRSRSSRAPARRGSYRRATTGSRRRTYSRRSSGSRRSASGGTMKLVVEVQNASPVSRPFLNPTAVAGALPRRAKF